MKNKVIKIFSASIVLALFLIFNLSSCALAKKALGSIIVEKEETTTTEAEDTTMEVLKEAPREETQSSLSEDPDDLVFSDQLKESFETFKNSSPDYSNIFEFIDENIESANSILAEEIIDFALVYAEENIESFTDKYADADIQQKLWTDYEGLTDLEILKTSSDEAISDLAAETLERRYKIFSVEGFIMPIIDYKAYEIYKDYLSAQMNDYIAIMSEESENPSVVDMGLRITLEEYAQRIVSLYQFKNNHPEFRRISEIKNRLSGKLWVYMSGIDNTPVFDYEGNIIQERLDDFLLNIEKYDNTEFAYTLHEYTELLERENYKMTQNVMDYLNSLVNY